MRRIVVLLLLALLFFVLSFLAAYRLFPKTEVIVLQELVSL